MTLGWVVVPDPLDSAEAVLKILSRTVPVDV